MQAWYLWIARRLWWGTVLIGIAAGLAAREAEIRTVVWGLFVLAAALSIIDQVLFFVEEREWVRDYLSTLGPRMLLVRVLSTGLPFYFVLRLATLMGVALLTYWIAEMLHWST
jgi:hypothetical protein